MGSTSYRILISAAGVRIEGQNTDENHTNDIVLIPISISRVGRNGRDKLDDQRQVWDLHALSVSDSSELLNKDETRVSKSFTNDRRAVEPVGGWFRCHRVCESDG